MSSEKQSRHRLLKAFRKAKAGVKKGVVGASFKEQDFKKFYLPLIEALVEDRECRGIATYCVGIGGGNGVGKSSLAKLIAAVLKELGFKAVTVSVDDFYKSSAGRKKLAEQFSNNRFYQLCRGMPGTHRIELLERVTKRAKQGKPFILPVFDKSALNGFGEISRKKIKVKSGVDFFIVEGVWIGLRAMKASELLKICRREESIWATVKEQRLGQRDFATVLGFLKEYSRVFSLFDKLIVMVPLKAHWAMDWRWEQEKRMLAKGKSGMTKRQIHDFVKPWLPLLFMYNHFYLGKKTKANAVLMIGKNHRVKKLCLAN